MKPGARFVKLLILLSQSQVFTYLLGTQCMNSCTLKGTVGRECTGHRGRSRPILRAPACPILPRPLVPVYQQPHSSCPDSHALTVLAPLASADSTERLGRRQQQVRVGLAPAVGVSSGSGGVSGYEWRLLALIVPQEQGQVKKP
ncbi:hypothetical protein MDA_GLEAN10018114 [Myotis davidii]|uniref:Secreted protein n=1 Tax=Myotis davidii TaxID=225400 RepID=L5LGB2_MYODS|nr:hypothetical protein MDA_GLEAN10018114 [Myotis davidii]